MGSYSMGSYSSGGEILPKQCSFVPHFRGSYSWLRIGNNINFAYCPARGSRGGSYSVRFSIRLKNNKFVPIPRGVIP